MKCSGQQNEETNPFFLWRRVRLSLFPTSSTSGALCAHLPSRCSTSFPLSRQRYYFRPHARESLWPPTARLCSLPARFFTGDALRKNPRAGQAPEAGGTERRRKTSRRRLPVREDSPQDPSQVHPHGHPRGAYEYRRVAAVGMYFTQQV